MSQALTHPRNLNIFIINAKHLTKRIESITRIIQVIAIHAKAAGFSKVCCNTMRVWEKEDIQAKIAEYNERVSMEACGDQVYDQLIGDISVEVLSNMEKHKHTWKMISEASSAHDINLIIEDDAIIMNEHVSNLKETLAYLYDASHDSQWDILFWGMAQENPKDVPPPNIVLTRFDKLCNKLIPSKEAYFINKQTAAQLYSVWCNPAFKVSYALRIQLSKYLYFNTGIKAMFPNRRVTLDGSKLGLFPTTIHSCNSLIYNGEFVKLLQIYMLPEEEIHAHMPAVNALYKVVQNAPNKMADVYHLYGMIQMKIKKYVEAEEAFVQAVSIVVEQQGLLNNRSELMNNAVNVYKHLQTDVGVGGSVKLSKYEIPGVIPLVDC